MSARSRRITTPEWLDLASLARRLARRRPESADDADDVAQEALTRLVTEERGSTFPIDNPASWLRVVIRNLAVRRGKRRERIREAERHFASERSVPSPSRAESLLLTREVLAELRDEDRQLLVLHALGHKHREIAERVGGSTSSVGIRIRRARARAATIVARSGAGGRRNGESDH